MRIRFFVRSATYSSNLLSGLNNNDHTNASNYHQQFRMRLHYATAEGGFISATKSELLPAEKIGKKRICFIHCLQRGLSDSLTQRGFEERACITFTHTNLLTHFKTWSGGGDRAGRDLGALIQATFHETEERWPHQLPLTPPGRQVWDYSDSDRLNVLDEFSFTADYRLSAETMSSQKADRLNNLWTGNIYLNYS